MTAHRNPFEPATPAADPDCHVAPRYLAGPRGDMRRVTRLLDDAGWEKFVTHQDAFHYFAPDRQVCVCYLPKNKGPKWLGLGKGLWHLWGREAPSGPADWQATATAACPPELLGEAILAMAALEPDEPQGSGPYGMGPLADAKWRGNVAGPLTFFTAPDDRATVCHSSECHRETHPSFPLTAAWSAEVRPVPSTPPMWPDPSTPPMWGAGFTASTPLHVITAFCAALTDPTPLPRRTRHLNPYVRRALSLT